MSRVGTMHGDDGSFDREFWARVPPAERLALVWDMVLEAQEWRGQIAALNAAGARYLVQNRRASGRPQDLLDVSLLESD